MFNLKRKAKSLISQFKDPQKVVAEIHEAFDTSTDRLLAEAKNILGGSYDLEKGERLKKLGFVSAKKSVETDKIKTELQENENLAKLIESYSVKYPKNKFITEKMVKEICQKYGLLFGKIQYYISDVPEKNISEMEGFSLMEEDMIKHNCWYYKYIGSGYYRHSTKDDCDGYGYIKRGNTFLRQLLVNQPEDTKVFYEKPQFKICASVKDFDTQNMRIENGYRLEQNLPDPIVLQPVNGGYLVVTKWGPEANDQSLVNEIKN